MSVHAVVRAEKPSFSAAANEAKASFATNMPSDAPVSVAGAELDAVIASALSEVVTLIESGDIDPASLERKPV